MNTSGEQTQVQHKPLKEEIFEALHRQIIAGTYPPGEWLRQEEIAGQMGVSMTPVREALDLLVAAGLAERVPYRGVRVLELSQQEIVEAYGLRLALEQITAREAARHITPEQVSALYDALDRMQGLNSLSEMSHARQLSREFHSLILEAAGNALLSKLYGIVSNSFPDWMLYEAMFRHPERLEKSLQDEQEEHRAIVDALAQGDADGAAEGSARHVLNLGRDLESLLEIPAELLREKERVVSMSNSK